jgi:preprotein translocase subunit SecA
MGMLSLFGSSNFKVKAAQQAARSLISSLEAQVLQVHKNQAEIAEKSNEELVAEMTALKERAKKEALNNLIPEVFAYVREATKRTLNMEHYDVQLLGGMVLSRGSIAEMRTGEGKTLVATLPVVLHALKGEGVHVVTVNDYLARRDAAWMGQIYNALGLTLGIVTTQGAYLYDPTHIEEDAERDAEGSFRVFYDFLKPATKAEAYAADITYGTNNEFGFDYLRDNTAYRKEDVVQRGHAFALVDEIDSILIDEARTPLIIAAPANTSDELYQTMKKVADTLIEETDFTKDEKHRSIAITEAGIEKAEKFLGIENMYSQEGIKYVHHLETAVKARALYRRDKEYSVRDGEVVIVDEFTGRLQPGRRWSEGLHQAIEAKEGVEVKRESKTIASVTFQNYFRLYKNLAGMTGTALTSAEEFYTVYGLDVVPIPTHRGVQRVDRDDLIFQSVHAKEKAITEKVKELNKKGQPVLIGTVSVEDNERLSELLARANVPHEVLNAKNHEREGEIIAQAGRKGGVTLATNMAGRGVDIKLGGISATEAEREEVLALGGLYVLGTERHDARRIDNQLRGRSGRQGDPGETQFMVSLDDRLMRVFGGDRIKGLMERFKFDPNEPLVHPMVTKSLETAQTRIEGFNFDSRKSVLSYDDVLNHQRLGIYAKRKIAMFGEDTEFIAAFEGYVAGEGALKETAKRLKLDPMSSEFISGMRHIFLSVVDTLWTEHLETMDSLRSSVSLRAYGQRDPLVEYRKEGLRLYQELEQKLSDELKRILPLVTLQQSTTTTPEGREYSRNDLVKISNGTETREVKFKKAETLLKEGWKIVQ